MSVDLAQFLKTVKWNLPWLARYPSVRGSRLFNQNPQAPNHIIFTVGNHFEPAWKRGGAEDLSTQIKRLKDYYKKARSIGEAVSDEDRTKFRHTNFYPAEQYHAEVVDIAAEMQAEGLGELE